MSSTRYESMKQELMKATMGRAHIASSLPKILVGKGIRVIPSIPPRPTTRTIVDRTMPKFSACLCVRSSVTPTNSRIRLSKSQTLGRDPSHAVMNRLPNLLTSIFCSFSGHPGQPSSPSDRDRGLFAARTPGESPLTSEGIIIQK